MNVKSKFVDLVDKGSYNKQDELQEVLKFLIELDILEHGFWNKIFFDF